MLEPVNAELVGSQHPRWKTQIVKGKAVSSLGEPVGKEELESMQKSMEECTCRVGGPRGPIGIVERVYQGRKTLAVKAKVLMESGAVRYVDVIDIRCY